MHIFNQLDREFGVVLSERCNLVLSLATELLDGKFQSRRKSNRTEYAVQAFGRHYPEELNRLSREIDRFTAACDDLNDDLNMDKEEKGLLLALLAKTVWAILDTAESRYLSVFSDHVKKMVYIQVAEQETIRELAEAKSIEDAYSSAHRNYHIRSSDMDVFVILPCVALGLGRVENLVEAGRCFRCMDLFYKDLADVEHDRAHLTSTPILLLEERGFSVEDFAKQLADRVNERLAVLERNAQLELEMLVIENFSRMIGERAWG